MPRVLETAENGDDVAVSVEDILDTYSPRTKDMVIKYPQIMEARSGGKRLVALEKEFDVSSSTIGYYATRSMCPKVYTMLESCRWLPLKKSDDLDFLVGYVHDHGYIPKSMRTAKVWNADMFELQRIKKRMQIVFKRNFRITKDRRIYVINTDSLTARALHLAGVPVGKKVK